MKHLAIVLFSILACGGTCPQGSTSVPEGGGHRCVSALDGSPDAGSGSADGAGGTSGSGCADGQGELLFRTWGCPGIWTKGGARARCAQGFHIATDTAQLDLVACQKSSNFYVADALGYVGPQNSCTQPASCQPTADNGRLRFGCGKVLASEVEQGCPVSCGDFDQDIVCSVFNPTLSYACAHTTGIDVDQNMEPTIGVLCVHD